MGAAAGTCGAGAEGVSDAVTTGLLAGDTAGAAGTAGATVAIVTGFGFDDGKNITPITTRPTNSAAPAPKAAARTSGESLSKIGNTADGKAMTLCQSDG